MSTNRACVLIEDVLRRNGGVDLAARRAKGSFMNPFRSLPAMVIAAAMLLSGAAQAMPMQVYDRMSVNDQADYDGVLIKGAEQVLTDEGRPDQAAQVEKLFTTIEPGDEHSLGMVELELNLAVVPQADADNLVKNPNAKPLPVEIAIIVTLKKNGVILPKNIMHVGDNFQPKDPLSPPPEFGSFSQCIAYLPPLSAARDVQR